MMKKNKVILVVGSNGLLGKSICSKLKKEGYKIIGVDNSYNTQNKILNFKKTNQVNFHLDVTQPSKVDHFFKKNENFLKKLDGLIYGPTTKTSDFYSEFTKLSFLSWKKILETELNGAFKFSQNYGRILEKKKKGNIIFISSIYGIVTNDNRMYTNTNIAKINSKIKIRNKKFYSSAAYPVAKSGLIAIAKYLAAYWGNYDVRVNTVSPGSIEKIGKNKEDKKFLKRYLSKVPMSRRAKPHEITNVIKFLLSDDSSYITGQNIIVDGGYTIW